MSNPMIRLSYGLFVLTANENGRDNGCIINTAGQVTTDPNQITITVNKSNLTCEMIQNTRKFTVSVISEAADFGLFRRFGFASGRDTDKFAGFYDTRREANGALYITKGTNAFISGWVTQSVDLGTHILFIATVTHAGVISDDPSATYAFYHSNIKPKPEAAKRPDGKTVWRCTVCGYEYEGEELPEDFICPICKHPASDFEKVS